MAEDPISAVYSYVERAYIRLQAGDLLIRCLEEGNITPMQQLVEGLVLAGPQSMNTLQEVLAETSQRKSQIMDDLQQVFSGFEKHLKSYGIKINGMSDAVSLNQLTAIHFLAILREQYLTEEKKQIECLHLLQENKELVTSLVSNIRLLEEIETYLRDWLWGLAYESARQRTDHKSSF